jgi:sugar (pentulose or hexulose) kinase
MGKYILSIDQGTQSTKISVFDFEGNELCSAKHPLQAMVTAPGGIAEQHEDIYESIVETMQELMERFTGDPKEIIGIGLGSIRFDRVLMKKDGTLAEPIQTWMGERIGYPYQGTNPEVAYLSADTGYLTVRMTGNFVDTFSNYAGAWPIDPEKWDWSDNPDLFDYFGMPRDMLLELKMPGDVLGTLLPEEAARMNVPAHLPIIATANDKAVEALGAGLIDEDTVLISLGTYIAGMIANEYTPFDPELPYWSNPASIPNVFLNESGGIRRGMWMVSWFINDILAKPWQEEALSLETIPEELMNQAGLDVPAGSDGLMTVLDWLPHQQALYRKGTILGFDERHTNAHIYRSILEAIAYTMKLNVDAMLDRQKITRSKLVITGWGSNSDLFMQIFADVFNLPATRNVINGAASLGAAINVAVGLGVYPDYETAIEKMVRQADTFEPNAENADVYQTAVKNYASIRDITDQYYKTANEVTEGAFTE